MKSILPTVLFAKFHSWIGTDSEGLLEDGGLVQDHLSDEVDRSVLDQLTEADWDNAWEEFDAMLG